MSSQGSPRRADRSTAEAVLAATAPARWLLEAGVDGGVALTATYALARVVVREAAARWPGWWNAELFGAPHREADLPVLEALHDGLRRLRLVRRRGRKLHTTVRGRELARDPQELLRRLAEDLGGRDPFAQAVARALAARLAGERTCDHDGLVAAAVREAHRGCWRDPDGRPPDERGISWVITGVLCRGEAYGLIGRRAEPGRFSRSRIGLTGGGESVLGRKRHAAGTMAVLVFDAELVVVRTVRARLAVGGQQHLTALHDAIQQAFGWADDHLYSFWLDGQFWGSPTTEFARPGTPDSASASADVPLAELDLAVGRQLAYIFDYGDEWRVRLTLREQVTPDGGDYPRVLEREGRAPAQYRPPPPPPPPPKPPEPTGR